MEDLRRCGSHGRHLGPLCPGLHQRGDVQVAGRHSAGWWTGRVAERDQVTALLVLVLVLAGCAPGNFFCKGKGTLTSTAMLYNATVTFDCGEGALFSKGAKSLPLPPGLAPEHEEEGTPGPSVPPKSP